MTADWAFSFAATARYVVLNPVRARLVKSVREWTWSSYPATAAQRSGPTWLTTDWLWAQFADTPQRAVRAYRRFVTEGLKGQPWQELTGQIYYGDGDFMTAVTTTVARETKSHEVPRRQRQPLRLVLAQWSRGALRRKSGAPIKRRGIG